MAKKKIRIKNRQVTKTVEPKPTQIVVQEIRVQSADRNKKDIQDYRSAMISAESVHYPNPVRLFDLYDYVLLDGHLSGIIGKRIDAVLNKKLIFETTAGKKVDAMDDVIAGETFREVIRKIMETPAWGRSGMEFIPGPEFTFKEIPRKHIKPHKKVITVEQNGDEGIPYEPLKHIWVLGKDNDLGYLLKAAPYAIWKRGNMGDWAQYIEIFGQPVRVIYYDAHDSKTKMELREVLDESGSALALMIPNQAKFEMMDGKQSNGTGDLQEKFKTACNSEMSIVVLGNTETTTSSSSSGYAQSKEHGKQQLEITKSDMAYVANLLNSTRFLTILQSFGYPVADGRFKFEKEIDLESLKVRIDIDEKVDKLVPLDPDYIYETYGIPKPANFDALMKERKAEKEAKLNKPAPGLPVPKPKPVKKKLSAGMMAKLRRVLADFFDPAP